MKVGDLLWQNDLLSMKSIAKCANITKKTKQKILVMIA